MTRLHSNSRARVVAAAVAGLLLHAGAGSAHADSTSCVPATTPCQTCPPPPVCNPSSTPCGRYTGSFQSTTASFITCSGATNQETTLLETTIGPGNICMGVNKSVGCLVPAGKTNLNFVTHTIVGVTGVSSTVTVPIVLIFGRPRRLFLHVRAGADESRHDRCLDFLRLYGRLRRLERHRGGQPPRGPAEDSGRRHYLPPRPRNPSG